MRGVEGVQWAMIGTGEARARARRGAKFAVGGVVEAIGMGIQTGSGAGIAGGSLGEVG